MFPIKSNESRARAHAPASSPARRLAAALLVLVAALPATAYDSAESRDWGGDADGESWFRLGWRLHHEERWDEAIAAFARALDEQYRRPVTSYNIACGYARKGERDLALAWLEEALAHGFRWTRILNEDPDLGSIRDDPRFRRIAEAVARKAAGEAGRDRG